MANPSKPTNVKISALKSALADLQDLNDYIQEPPGGVFQGTSGSIEQDLAGMQNNAARVAGERYSDGATYVGTYMWKDVASGVATLMTLLQQTIDKHSTTDTNAAGAATGTNTTQGGTSGSSGSTSGTTSSSGSSTSGSGTSGSQGGGFSNA